MNQTAQVFILQAPINLKISRETENGTIQGFLTEPFMSPFVDFSTNMIFPINSFHVLSISIPSEDLLKRYEKILKLNYDPDEEIESEVDMPPNFNSKKGLH